MKRIFTLMMVFILSNSLFAQPGESSRRYNYQSRISISTTSNSQVWVLIDGKSYNSRNNGNDILVNDIRPGYHTVKVYQQRSDKYNNGRWPNNNRKLIYESGIHVKPNYHLDITINRFGKVFTDERQMNSSYYSDFDDDGYGGNGWGNNENYMQPMNNQSFAQFIQVIKNERFDNTRLTLAKQTITVNNFSANQVREIVQQFGFDDSRLDIAKFSYKNTIDKNNYFVLNDVFSFSSSKEELARYIQAYR